VVAKLSDVTVVSNSSALNLGGSGASIGGIQISGTSFRGNVSAVTVVSKSLALNISGLGGLFGFFGIAHIGGVQIK
jgi:hypothetical protein